MGDFGVLWSARLLLSGKEDNHRGVSECNASRSSYGSGWRRQTQNSVGLCATNTAVREMSVRIVAQRIEGVRVLTARTMTGARPERAGIPFEVREAGLEQ